MIVHVEGMHCVRCAAKVEKAMEELNLKAKVNLEEKICVIDGEGDREAITAAIEEKGFQVTNIE